MIPTAPRSGGGGHHHHNHNHNHSHSHYYSMARTTAFFAGLDANLQLGLAMVFCLYLIVTVGTFTKLPSPHNALMEVAVTGHIVRRRAAKVLLHGKLYDPATTADALQELIQQEEAKLNSNNSNNGEASQQQQQKQALIQKAVNHNPHDALAAAAANNPNDLLAAQAAAARAKVALANKIQAEQAAKQAAAAQAAVVQVDMEAIQQVQKLFPVRAGDDTELIDHPGYKYADLNNFGNNPPPAKMTVPKYWNPPAYGGDVRKYLGDYGKRLITPQEALSIGSKTPDGQETIYITIASYRDPECPITIDSIFTRAKHPHRLKIAVIDQLMFGTDHKCIEPQIPCEQDPHQTLCQYANQIESLEMDARLGIGPVFARHLGYRHYRGEYFAMQVDAHVRFVQDWDASLVDQWKSSHNEMGVLTTYLSDLNNSIDPVTNTAIRPGRPIMCATDYEGTGKYKHLRHGQQPEGPAMIHGQPTLHPFWAAGFSFGRGHFVLQVPYDQYLPMIFQGEEISIGLRGFTFGYDYYTPEKSVCFHMYAMLENKDKRDKVPHFWENTATYRAAGIKAMQRLNGIIGMGDPLDEYDHSEEEKYSLGWIRNKEKFFRTFGIHTDTQTVEGHLCSFVGQPMQRLFLRAMRDDQMGLDYDQINYEWKDPNPKKKE